MKITRDEFKELVELYEELQDMCKEYEDIFNEVFLDELYFKTINWIEDKLEVGWTDEEDALLHVVNHNKDNKLNNRFYHEELLDLDFVYDELIPDKNKDN